MTSMLIKRTHQRPFQAATPQLGPDGIAASLLLLQAKSSALRAKQGMPSSSPQQSGPGPRRQHIPTQMTFQQQQGSPCSKAAAKQWR